MLMLAVYVAIVPMSEIAALKSDGIFASKFFSFLSHWVIHY